MALEVMTREEILQKIVSLSDLPTLPDIAQRVIALAQDPEVNFRDLKKIIITDPPLSAKILRLANSAAYGRRVPAQSVDEALVTLGLEHLLAICNTVGLLRAFDAWESVQLDRRILWRHALATAFLAKSLEYRKMVDDRDAPDMFLTGLVHNIGWILFDHLSPNMLSAALRTAKDINEWTLDTEQVLLGVDHAEAGAVFLRRWGLPESICSIVQYHHDPDSAKEYGEHAGILQISSVLAPYPFPLDVTFEKVSDKIPHMLKKKEGQEAIDEMQIRYLSHISQAKKMTDLMLEWL